VEAVVPSDRTIDSIRNRTCRWGDHPRYGDLT